MSPLAQRVAAAVHGSSPRVLCFGCLAAQQGLGEHDVRALVLVLISRAGLELVRRPCDSCGRTDEVLASPAVAPSCQRS